MLGVTAAIGAWYATKTSSTFSRDRREAAKKRLNNSACCSADGCGEEEACSSPDRCMPSRPSERPSEFEIACDYVASQDLDTKLKLLLYGLYKQALNGDAPENLEISGPVRLAMANAWKREKGKTREEAAQDYVALLDKHRKGWRKFIDDEESGGASDFEEYPSAKFSKLSEPTKRTPKAEPSALVEDNDLKGLEKYLSKHPGEIDALNSDGLAALHIAVDRGHLEIVKFLVSKKAKINITDPYGDTPLHFAAVLDRLEIAKLLVNAGADKNARNFSGDIPVDMAESEGMKVLLTQ